MLFYCGIVVFDDKSLETSFSCHPRATYFLVIPGLRPGDPPARQARGELKALCSRDRDAPVDFVNSKGR